MSNRTGINKRLAVELLGATSRDPSEVSRLSMKKYNERKQQAGNVSEECYNTSASNNTGNNSSYEHKGSTNNSCSNVIRLSKVFKLGRIRRELVIKSKKSDRITRKIQFATIEDLRRDRKLRAAPILEMLKGNQDSTINLDFRVEIPTKTSTHRMICTTKNISCFNQ